MEWSRHGKWKTIIHFKNFNQKFYFKLLTGNFGLSYDQSKAQMAIWAILAAPFLLSNDLRKITPEMKALILNKEVIAIDQDDMGVQGKRYSVNNNIEVN